MTNALKVNVWMCGDCGAYHDTQEEAEGCCMKEDHQGEGIEMKQGKTPRESVKEKG